MARTKQTARARKDPLDLANRPAEPYPSTSPAPRKISTLKKAMLPIQPPEKPTVLPEVPVKHADFISYLNAHSETPVAELVEPYKQYDAEIRKVFAQEPGHSALADQHLNIVPVFGENQATSLYETELKIRARDLASESQAEKDKYLMPLEDEHRKPNGSPAVVQSLKEFQTHFNYFCESSLVDLDWSNVVAAGSSVVTPLLPVPEKYAGSKRGLRQYYHEILAPASDVDLFIYGLSEEDAVEKIKQIETQVKDAILEETTTIRTKNAITIASHYPTRHIQIVLRIYKSVAEILTGFDVDCSCAAYDGKMVYAAPRAIASYVTQRNVIDLTRRSPSYENRLSKYSHRGFEVYWPQLDRSRIDPTIFERNFGRTAGLARLLVLEKLPKASDRDSYLDQRRRERGRPPINRGWRYQMQGNIKDMHEDEVADWVDDDEVSDYHTFTVPYGEKFHARKIEKLLYTKDLLLNAEWNKPKDREVNLHRHPAFFGRVEDVIHDCCGYCPKPRTLEEEEVAEVEGKIYVSGDISFIKDDPGRQAIGSFNPLTEDDWTEMAYVGNTARLCQAIVDHDLDLVEQHLKQEGFNLDPNCRDYTGRTPLHLAVQTSTPEIVKCLVDSGARMIARLADGRTALHLAAAHGNAQMIKILLEKSEANEAEEEEKVDAKRAAWLAAKKNTGETPDTEQGLSEEKVLSSLVEEGEFDKNTETPDASEGDMEDDMEGDLEEKIEMHSATTDSFVHVKPAQGPSDGDNVPPEENEQDPDIYDINVLAWDTPCSPLHLAIVNGHREAVRELVQNFGADILLPIKLMNTFNGKPRAAILTLVLALRLPLEEAKKMTQLLLELGASSAQADMDQITALHRFVGNGTEILDVLFEHDAPAAKRALDHVAISRDSYSPSTVTPLLTAIAAGNPTAARKLIDAGAKLSIDFASWMKSYRLRNEFVDRNTTDYHEKFFQQNLDQPVMYAAQKDLPDLVVHMLDLGADPNTMTPNTWQVIHNEYARRNYEGQTLLDVARDQLEDLRKYDGEPLNLDPPKPRFEGDGQQFVEPFKKGTYRRFVAEKAVREANEQFEGDKKRHEEQVEESKNKLGLQEKRDAINKLIEGFTALEKKLLEMDAKTFKELYPEIECFKQDRNQFGFSFGQSKIEPKEFTVKFDFLLPDLTPPRREAYVDLLEAAWNGNLQTIKELTLAPWGPETDGQQEKPLQIAVQDITPLSPFSIAVQRGHYDVAKAILEIAQAQYSPEESTVKARYNMQPGEDDVSEDGNHDSEIQVYKEIIDDQFTIENIGEVSMQVNSKVSPLGMMAWHCRSGIAEETRPENKAGDKPTLIHIAIENDDLDLLKRLLQWGSEYTALHAKADDESASRFYSIARYDFDYAVKQGRTRHLAEIIKHTGAAMPLDHLVQKSGIEVKEKPKHYQGLSVYGQKRADWADAGRGTHRESPQDSHPPVLEAAWAGSIDSVEWFMSDAPQRFYVEFAEAHKNDKRLKGLEKAEGGFEKAISGWLNTRQNLLVHCVVMSTPPASTAFKLLDYALKVMPKSLETKDKRGRTPLYMAFLLERPNVAQHLIKAGANQATRSHDGRNIIHALLGDQGGPRSIDLPNHNHNHNTSTPNISTLSTLLHSISPLLLPSLLTARTSAGPAAATPLAYWLSTLQPYTPTTHPSTTATHTAILTLLLALSAPSNHPDLDLVNGTGDTPLHALVKLQAPALIALVLDRRPELLHRENATGRTPAEMAWDAHVGECLAAPPHVPGCSQHRFGYWRRQGPREKTPGEFVRGAGEEGGTQAGRVWGLCRERLGREGEGGLKRKLVSLGEANEVAKRLASMKGRDGEEEEEVVVVVEDEEDEVEAWGRCAMKGVDWEMTG